MTMKTENQLIGNFNELVFENRNKAYGAYVLRNSYNNNMSFSLFISIAFFAVVALVAFGLTKNTLPKIDTKSLKPDSTFSIEVVIPHDEILVMKKEKITEVEKPHTDTRNLTVTDEVVKETPKTNETMTINPLGTPDGKADSIPKSNDLPIGDVPTKKPVDDKAAFLVSDMPEFNGDLFQYLSRNIRYPQIAVENQTEGQVFLTFVVEKDGSIGDVKTLKPLRDGCTEEAIRVVSSMPKWKPGRNHGELVRVQYNLPIKFRLK
jgi:periplasmic protein TonB